MSVNPQGEQLPLSSLGRVCPTKADGTKSDGPKNKVSWAAVALAGFPSIGALQHPWVPAQLR